MTKNPWGRICLSCRGLRDRWSHPLSFAAFRHGLAWKAQILEKKKPKQPNPKFPFSLAESIRSFEAALCVHRAAEPEGRWAPAGHRGPTPVPVPPAWVGVRGRDGGHLARRRVPGDVGKAGSEEGCWVSFRVSCLACAGTGKVLHPWLYTSTPPPPQPAKNPTITGFSSPPGRPMRDEGFWEGACSFI